MVSSASILLTSRPGIPIHISQCLTGKIVIKGFKSLNEFIETANNKNSSQLLAALEMKPELHSLCHLPLHAVIFIHLFDFLKDKLPTTRTGLFYPLVCNFLVRHIQTRTTYDLVAIKNLPSDLPDDIHLSLRKISKLAYQSLIERNIFISHEILKSVGINPFTDDTMGFLRAHPRITMSGPTNLYTFLHLSIQDFLAALHISLLDEHDQENAFELIFRQNPLSPVPSFYAGLTGLLSDKVCGKPYAKLQKSLDITKIVKELRENLNPACDARWHLSALINCIYEAQNPELIARFLLSHREIKEQCSRFEIPLCIIPLYPTDCLSIGYIARHASKFIDKL